MDQQPGAQDYISVDKAEARIEEINLQRLILQRDIELLNKIAVPLADRLQDARIAKEEQSRPIRLVETAIIPEVPVGCLLYTSPSPRDATLSRMPCSA